MFNLQENNDYLIFFQNTETQEIEWRINLDGIHQAFKTEIAKIQIPGKLP